MNKLSALLLFILLSLVGFGQPQPDWKNYSFSSLGRSKTDTQPSLVTGIPSGNQYTTLNSNRPAALDSLMKAPGFMHHRPNNYYWVNSFDSTPAYFFVKGGAPARYGNYEFRVLLNGVRELLPWSALAAKPGPPAQKDLFLLGRYAAPCGGFLVVDLRERNTDSILCQAVVNYPAISPVLARVYTPDEFNLFFKKLGQSHDLLRRDTPLSPTLLRFKPLENNLIFYLTGNITHREQLEYQVLKGGEVYSDWRPNDFDNPFIWLRNLPPGDYELKMRYPVQRSHVTSYPFRIAAAWHQTSLFWIVLGSLAASFFASILLFLRTRNQRRSLARERLKKETMETELRALRSQLNPHFVFNSLNSIQGLINRSDEEGANRYLTSFATLMRDVLSGAARENNPLHQEIRILEHYLRLEQLRCDFAYTVETDPQINSFEVEIPSLLIQPLVENSVKHAMAHLDGKGQIGIRFTRRDNDLVAAIDDNGQGFDPEKNSNGFGLGLTRKRVSLVNELSSERKVRMEIESEQGTSVRIFFNNWLT